MWRRITPFAGGRPPNSLQLSGIQRQTEFYVWEGRGRPDPSLLPDGFAQARLDAGRAYRAPCRSERFVRAAIAVGAITLVLAIADGAIG